MGDEVEKTGRWRRMGMGLLERWRKESRRGGLGEEREVALYSLENRHRSRARSGPDEPKRAGSESRPLSSASNIIYKQAS